MYSSLCCSTLNPVQARIECEGSSTLLRSSPIPLSPLLTQSKRTWDWHGYRTLCLVSRRLAHGVASLYITDDTRNLAYTDTQTDTAVHVMRRNYLLHQPKYISLFASDRIVLLSGNSRTNTNPISLRFVIAYIQPKHSSGNWLVHRYRSTWMQRRKPLHRPTITIFERFLGAGSTSFSVRLASCRGGMDNR